jgi:hypothetical protein
MGLGRDDAVCREMRIVGRRTRRIIREGYFSNVC